MRAEDAERRRKNEEVRAKVAESGEKKARSLDERSANLQEADFHRQQRADQAAKLDSEKRRRIAWAGVIVAVLAIIVGVVLALLKR